MEQQINQFLDKPNQGPKNIWLVVFAVITTAIVVGGGVYWWQKSVIKSIQNENLKSQQKFQEQIDGLQEQVAQLQKEEVEESEKPITDNRILLTPENFQQYSPNCKEEFNFDSATTTVTYSSQAKGISLEIPYNSQWGSDKYRINPYDESKESLVFGPVGAGNACALTRSYFLIFRPAGSAEEVISNLEKEPDFPELFSLEPKKIFLTSLEVIKYQREGMCVYPTLQVIGRKHNYELRPECGSGKEFPYLENIVKTIRLID